MATPVGRLRLPRSAFVGVAVLTICVLPLVGLHPAGLLLLLVPLAAGLYTWRTGADFDDAGVRVRAVFGSTRVGWDDVAGLETRGRGELWLVRRDGRTMRLPTARSRDLIRLHQLSAGRLGVPPPEGHVDTPRG